MTSRDGSSGPTGERNDNGRSASPPLKRSASELGSQGDIVMDSDSFSGDTRTGMDGGNAASSKAKKQSENSSRHRRESSVDMMGDGGSKGPETAKGSSEEGAGSGSDNVYPTPSSMSTYTTAASEESRFTAGQSAHSSHDAPPIDEQVSTVMELAKRPPQENEKGYVVSRAWLNRVIARCTIPQFRDVVDKTAAEGEIGPVDNSDLVLVTDPSSFFKDEAGDPFVPLRPGLDLGEHFEVLPEQAWNLIMKWYGLSKDSPAIVRYAHNTNIEGGLENVQYELNPPIFTILKLASPATATSQAAKDKVKPPARTLASTHTPVQTWLKDAKKLANIDVSTKVRVWRILEHLGSGSGSGSSGIVTPAASRSVSPAPGSMVTASAGNSLVVDVTRFLALREGSGREQLEIKDQTSNEKYNGKSTLHIAGLGGDSIILLEEQAGGPGGGEWASETSKSGAKAATVGAKGSHSKLKPKSATSSGRSSPAPNAVRGRRRKDGKPRGVTGLSNLGNTCYMNSALQCVKSVEELTLYFLREEYKKDLNPSNPLAHNGDVAKAYANLLRQLFDENGAASFAPRGFKSTIGRYGPAFSGYGQQDSQEFVLFLLDGLQEDLNRIHKKPYIEKPDSTDEMVHDKAALNKFAHKNWEIYKARNDSVITDLFAGMYKSTLHCPVCDKVSIIFDPFNNLTLQLPIENLWSRDIFYFPLRDKPVIVEVEIDKNATVKALKEYVAKKVKADAQRFVMAEIYKNKFYKVFENTLAISEAQITSNDDIAIFELESVPTSYDPDKVKKQTYTSYMFGTSLGSSDDEPVPFDSPQADRTLVPIYNRVERPNAPRTLQRQLFGAPLFTVINKSDAFDYDAILRNILARISVLTTRDVLSEEEDVVNDSSTAAEDSDTVLMNDEDATMTDPQVKDSSVEGEDGLVDVSMRDSAETESSHAEDSSEGVDKSLPNVLRPGSFITPMFRNLFDVRVAKTNSATATGFSTVEESKDFQPMASRVLPKGSKAQRKQKKPRSMLNVTENSPVSSEDELSTSVTPLSSRIEEDSSSAETKTESISDSDSDVPPTAHPTIPKKSRQQKKASQTPLKLPYIRPGEAIVLDWKEDAYEALFGGDAQHTDSLRGTPTWENIQRLPDPELTRKRQLRQSKRRAGINLYDCLDEYGKEEILSENDAWYCPRCKEHQRASKKFELWTSPDILVMHLKRFSANRGFRDKIDVLVDFPQELDMTGRVQMPEEGKSLIYDLVGVDNHYGGLGGGHYTAFAKNFVDGHWYEYNDSHVSRKLDPAGVVTRAAYLLFYRRRSDHPLGGEYLAGLTEEAYSQAADSDSGNSDSGANTPSGEGKRLGDSSRNGSSSASAAVGAAHQAGDGGLRGGIRPSDNDNDTDNDNDLPAYSDGLKTGEQRLQHGGLLSSSSGMDVDDDEGYAGTSVPYGPLDFANNPGWSFDRIPDAYDESTTQIMQGPFFDSNAGGYINLDDDDDNDNSSTKAMGSVGSNSGHSSPTLNIHNMDEEGNTAAGPDTEDKDMLSHGSIAADGEQGFIRDMLPPQSDDDGIEMPVEEPRAPGQK